MLTNFRPFFVLRLKLGNCRVFHVGTVSGTAESLYLSRACTGDAVQNDMIRATRGERARVPRV